MLVEANKQVVRNISDFGGKSFVTSIPGNSDSSIGVSPSSTIQVRNHRPCHLLPVPLFKHLCVGCGKEWVWPESFYDFIEYITSYNWPSYIVTGRLLYPTVLHHYNIMCCNPVTKLFHQKCFSFSTYIKCFMNNVISVKVGELAFSQLTDILSFIPQGVGFCGGNIYFFKMAERIKEPTLRRVYTSDFAMRFSSLLACPGPLKIRVRRDFEGQSTRLNIRAVKLDV